MPESGLILQAESWSLSGGKISFLVQNQKAVKEMNSLKGGEGGEKDT